MIKNAKRFIAVGVLILLGLMLSMAVPAQAADFDQLYTFGSIAAGEADWDYAGPSGNTLHNRGSNGYWSWSNTGTPSSGVGPSTGQGGSGGYVYTEASSVVSVNDEFTMTLSQAVDASAYALNCSFYRYMDFNNSPGELHFEVFDGSSWHNEGTWYGNSTTNWIPIDIDLSGYTNANLKVRFRTVVKGTTYTNDCGIDTVRIYGNSRGPVYHTITATTGSNGNISPSGAFTVVDGDPQTFTVTPGDGYQVDELLVDGLPDTLTGDQYTFPSVNQDHTISVTFSLIPTGGDDDDDDEGPPLSGCASNIQTDYSGGFDPLELDLANVGIENEHLVLQTGSQVVDPEHIVIPFTQEVTVTFLYEGTSWLADFGWVNYNDAVDGSGNFIGFENIPQDKLHPIFSNMKDDGADRWYPGNGVFDAEYGKGGFPYNNEAALANYDDGTGLKFVVDGDGSVTYKDMKKSLGIIEGGTEMVFWLVTGRLSGGDITDQDANGWDSHGGLVEADDWDNLDPVWGTSAIFFSKKDWNPDTYGIPIVPDFCNDGDQFDKIYRLGQAASEEQCSVDRGWLDQATIDRIAAGWGIVLSGEYRMPITMYQKYTHAVVGAPPDDPKQWILGIEDRNYNLDDSDMDHNDVTFRIERKTGGTVQLKADQAITPPNADSYYSGVTISVYDKMDGGACSGKNSISYAVSIDNGANWVEVDGWDTVKEFSIDGSGNKTLGADVPAWTPGDPEMTYRSRRIDFAGLGISGRELVWKATLISGDDQCVPEIIDVVLDASVAGATNFSRAAPVVLANVLYSGSYQTPSPAWTEQANRGHLKATRIYDPTNPDQTAEQDLWDAGEVLNSKSPGARTIYLPNIALTAVVDETIATGDGIQKTFSGTLAHHPVSATTLTITDSRESFIDKHTHDLEGSLTGTGTVNRFTGAYTLTFDTAPDLGVPVKADYSYYTTSSVLLSFAAANVTKEMLGLDDTYVLPEGYYKYDFNGDNNFDENDADWLVNWVRGYRDGTSTPKEWLLGPLDHSTPAILTPPGIPEWYYGTATTEEEKNSYMTFNTDNADRQTVVFAGSLDGMLHAFDGGTFLREDNPETVDITENRGHFLWEDRTSGTPAYCSSIPATCPNYGTGQELWAFIPANLVPRLKNNRLQGEDRAYVDASPALADVYIGGSWKTVLISAEGVGGDTVFCLDVTDPASPRFLWEFADPDLFRSRSSPSVGKIGRILLNGSAKWVAFFVSGKTYDTGLYPSIYMINIADGSVVDRVLLDTDAGGVGGVPSGQPSIMDSDANGYIDRLYIGTDKGLLYKVNIPDSPDTVKYGISSCVINKDFTDENSNTVPVDRRLQPIYGSPVAIADNRITAEGNIDYDIRIFFGTGDSPYFDEDINMAATRYYFFAYRDKSKKGQCDDSSVFLDWLYELPEGHRIYSSAFSAAGNIYFGTSTAETEDPCEGATSSAMYGEGNIDVFTMEGTKVIEKAVGNSFVSPLVVDQHLYFKSQNAEIQSFGAGAYNNRTIISGTPELEVKYWRELF